mmetsp:Transcript_3534/g.7607  ORF Transcript_3534/g.7607 Transcript_3534/m.7607 type:complete len:216 (+) Transcript_3534:343-990(+)
MGRRQPGTRRGMGTDLSFPSRDPPSFSGSMQDHCAGCQQLLLGTPRCKEIVVFVFVLAVVVATTTYAIFSTARHCTKWSRKNQNAAGTQSRSNQIAFPFTSSSSSHNAVAVGIFQNNQGVCQCSSTIPLLLLLLLHLCRLMNDSHPTLFEMLGDRAFSIAAVVFVFVVAAAAVGFLLLIVVVIKWRYFCCCCCSTNHKHGPIREPDPGVVLHKAL